MAGAGAAGSTSMAEPECSRSEASCSCCAVAAATAGASAGGKPMLCSCISGGRGESRGAGRGNPSVAREAWARTSMQAAFSLSAAVEAGPFFVGGLLDLVLHRRCRDGVRSEGRNVSGRSQGPKAAPAGVRAALRPPDLSGPRSEAAKGTAALGGGE